VEVVSSNVGSVWRSNLVTALRALKSTQNLYLGLPSESFLGTKFAGADQGDCSNNAFVQHVLDLLLHFMP